MTRDLSNDRLGAKGEARFKELCEDAGLIANKAGRDMMGWDYLVESPLQEDDGLPLDKRTQGPVFRVQIKTIWAREGGRISLSLSACELLAKTTDPALICTFVVNDDLEFLSASVIHIIDDKLARVLKRLRTASVEIDGKGLNEREITFSTEDASEAFKLTGVGLRRRLSEICGSDPREYREKKQKQLSELGYEERGRHELKTTLRVSNQEEIIDFFLGKKPIELLDVHSIDNRFGVSIPTSDITIPEGGRATLQLFPQNHTACRIRIRPAETKGSPAVFKGFVDAVPPEISLDQHTIAFRSELFRIEINEKGRIGFSTIAGAIDSTKMDLESWSHAFRLLRYVGQGSIVVEVKGVSSGAPHHEFRINTPNNQELEDYAAYMENIAAMASWLTDASGVHDLLLTKDAIETAADRIEMAYSQMSDAECEKLSFAYTRSDMSPLPTQQTMILAGRLDIGETHLCFARKLNFTLAVEGSQVVWCETASEAIRLQEFDGTDAKFSAIGSFIMSEVGADGIMEIQPEKAADA
ncbi:hypothetical protein E0H66_21485 [Rhizobium leguminosarum bv. viciae]|nr:hypothetical protein E0H66_21485 [Rhizobium leguminosarum bv. viciae]